MLDSLVTYLLQAQTCSQEAFVARNPHSVLILDPFSQSDEKEFQTLGSKAAVAASSGERQVAWIRKRSGANAFASMITLGRARNNDIQILSGAVSKFHAYFMVGAQPTDLTLTDAGSTFGTFLGKQKLTPKEDKLPIANGDRIQIGGVDALYLTPDGFYEYLSQQD